MDLQSFQASQEIGNGAVRFFFKDRHQDLVKASERIQSEDPEILPVKSIPSK